MRKGREKRDKKKLKERKRKSNRGKKIIVGAINVLVSGSYLL